MENQISSSPEFSSPQEPRPNLMVLIAVGVLILAIGIGIGYVLGKYSPKQISSYEDCMKAKDSTIQESYPGTCVTADEKRFVQPLTDEGKRTLLTDPAATANWKIYVNKKYGYQIKYPSNWKFTETDNPGLGDGPLTYTVIVPDITPLKVSGFINISISRKLTWSQFIKNAKQQGFQDYKFNGLDAMIFKKDGYDTLINLNSPTDKLISVSYGFTPNNIDKKIIDQILSTFTFIRVSDENGH